MKTLLIVLLLCGCAQPSGIVNVGPDTYISSSGAFGRGLPAAMAANLKEAKSFCTKNSKELLMQHFQNDAWSGTNTITFMCLNSDDPELKRPHYRADPNVIIEQQK